MKAPVHLSPASTFVRNINGALTKSIQGWSLYSTKHHRYWSVADFACQHRNSKPVYILHCTHHKWGSITGMAPQQLFFLSTKLLQWQKTVCNIWENQYLMLPQRGFLGLLIFSVSNWLIYEVLLAHYMSVLVFLTKDQITYCANFTSSSNQTAWLLSID